MKKHVIWTNQDLDENSFFEEDWKPVDEETRLRLMYEMNQEYLEDERANLNINMGMPIIVIADLGLWNGRRMAYKDILSGNICDCLEAGHDDDYVTWYVNEDGEFRCEAHHHDGTNYYTYRVFKPYITESQMDRFRAMLYRGIAKRQDINHYTDKLGPRIAEVYGWEVA